LRGLFMGLSVAVVLGLLDALWNGAGGGSRFLFLRLLVALIVGATGGGLGALFGQTLYAHVQWSGFLLLGWALTGSLVGSSLGAFDWLACRIRGEESAGAWRKSRNGLIGGVLGGLLGGTFYLMLRRAWEPLFADKVGDYWSPSTTGFIVLGVCIGLLIGLAQILFKEAWLRVEAGFRAGRELILSRPVIIIGRAESSDVGLFGDPQVDKRHCCIVRRGNAYVLTDEGSASGTYVNNERVEGSRILRSGDLIRLGRSLLRFSERQKRL
jgi:hypothetical protein